MNALKLKRTAARQTANSAVHHKLEELLDQYLKRSGLEKEPESPLFPATIGLIEKSLCGNHRFGELAPADAIASISARSRVLRTLPCSGHRYRRSLARL